ncbi:MAG TPA: cobalamin-binding protein [Clostridia bacterium]|nr:cobalamin-binding protein [Clostridia bacterium]
MFDLGDLAQSVIAGDVAKSTELTKKALEMGVAPLDIINKGLIAGMEVVGERFKKGDMFVPEVLVAARAMNSGLDLIRPLLAETDIKGLGTVVIGTVKGDLHDIGKNLVAMMMESGGFKVINLGVDVPVEKFVEAVRTHKPQIVGMSALLTTTMLVMRDVVSALKESGLRDSVKVMIGGAPVTADYAKEIGADGYAPDAVSATDLAKKFVAA